VPSQPGSGEIDVVAVRAATPGCEASTFLLSAGSSLPTQRTLDAVIAHLRLEAEIGGYAAAVQAAPMLERGRRAFAELVGGSADEVALTPSDSVAFAKAWWGWVLGGNVGSGETVWLDRLIYHSHYAAVAQTQGLVGFEVAVLPSLPDGTLDVDRVSLDGSANAVCATVVGTHSGNVNPVAELGAITESLGVPLFVDGCQALGQMALDVRDLRCQVFTGTGRKFLRGPRGTGVLWVSGPLIDRFVPPGIDGTNMDWTSAGLEVHAGMGRFAEYEVSYAAMVGLAHAAEQVLELDIEAIELRVHALAERLRQELSARSRVTVHDTAARRCGIVTFTVEGIDPAALVAAAEHDGVRINESTATYAAFDMEAKGLRSVVRASPHYFNTDEEIDRLLEVVDRFV
jgi:selenocysteine lyase/cysteine desulfurase